LILTGDPITGAEAASWGLVYRAVAAEDLDGAVAQLVDRLTAGSRQALAVSKRLVRAGVELPLAEGLNQELEAVLDHLAGPSGRHAVAAFTARETREET
jgi:enoyl-CoA hydratase/carnithine racemase